jgi:hypothetical protein
VFTIPKASMKTTLAALALLTALSGCAIYTPAGSVVIDPVGTVGQGGNGKHCPPGQAKKGNC